MRGDRAESTESREHDEEEQRGDEGRTRGEGARLESAREEHGEVSLLGHIEEGRVLPAAVGDGEEAVEADRVGTEGGNQVEVAREERRPLGLVCERPAADREGSAAESEREIGLFCVGSGLRARRIRSRRVAVQ